MKTAMPRQTEQERGLKIMRKLFDELPVTCAHCKKEVMQKDASWARTQSGSVGICIPCVQKYMQRRHWQR